MGGSAAGDSADAPEASQQSRPLVYEALSLPMPPTRTDAPNNVQNSKALHDRVVKHNVQSSKAQTTEYKIVASTRCTRVLQQGTSSKALHVFLCATLTSLKMSPFIYSRDAGKQVGTHDWEEAQGCLPPSHTA